MRESPSIDTSCFQASATHFKGNLSFSIVLTANYYEALDLTMDAACISAINTVAPDSVSYRIPF